MTVSYTANIATCRGLGNFWRLLFRWNGSIYKVMWAELIVYTLCFFTINMFYRFYLIDDCDKKSQFMDLVRYCDSYSGSIPVSFVLGFYVSIVVDRWWKQFSDMPWTDNAAMALSSLLEGLDDRGRLYRRTIMRYLVTCFIMSVSAISTSASVRFPTLSHLVQEGFLLEHERLVFEELNQKVVQTRYWLPIAWASLLARKARREGLIRDDISLNTVILYLNKFRGACQMMLNYDWISVPLVYTQVTTLAVYLYFMTTLFGKQLVVLKGEEDLVDLYFPLFNFLEFFFYFGWLKVAECLINPFGEDDDDFEIIWFIDRFAEVPMIIVDSMAGDHPNLMKDQYWDEIFPLELPYTEAAAKYKTEGQVGSTNTVEVKQAEFIKPTLDLDDNRGIKDSSITQVQSDAKQPTGEHGHAHRRASVGFHEHIHARVIPDVNELYEQDDVPYDPTEDEDKESKKLSY